MDPKPTEHQGFLAEPWNVIISAFEQRDDGPRIFNQIQKMGRGLGGFVICRWDKPGLPEKYYSESEISWVKFEDDRMVHYPKIHLTLTGAKNFIQCLKDEMDRIRITGSNTSGYGFGYILKPIFSLC